MFPAKQIFCTLLLFAACAHAQVVIHEINSPSANATGLCWDGAALWVSDYTNTIYRVDPVTGAVLHTITGPVAGSDGLAFDNGYLWTVSRVNGDQTIYKLDTLTGAVFDAVPDPTGGNAGGMVWEDEGFWLSQYFPQDRILKVDSSTQEIVANFPAPGQQPYGMAFDGVRLWNSSEDDSADRVYRINPANGQTLWSFDLEPHTPVPGRRPRGLAWDGQYLWLIAYEADGWQVKIFQYDVSNADNPDIDLANYSHDFGGHVIGFPVQWNTWLRNIGNVGLVIDSARFHIGLAYMLLWMPPFPVTIASGDSLQLTVDFDPPQPGLLPDTLDLFTNDPDEAVVQVVLAGTGLANEGDIELMPPALDFGDVRINPPILSSSRIIEIWNHGSGVLTVTGAEIFGDEFSLDSVLWPVEIDSSSFFRVRVWFTPLAYGLYEGLVSFASDDPDEPTIDLFVTGVGIDTPVEGGGVLWHYAATGDLFNGINSVQWIGDVNGDGVADALAASENHLVYCLNGSSSGIADTFWTYNTGADPNHSGIVYYERGMSRISDLNGDGVDDVIIGTSGGSRSVYALSGMTGEELWMFDTRFWGEGDWVYEVHPIADIDNDQLPDVVAAMGGGRVFAVSGVDGSFLWSGPVSGTFFSVRTIADVNGDDLPDVVGGGTDGVVQGLSSATGDTLWQADVGNGSPVFALLPMGNANPDTNLSEDVAVASAYEGIYVIDGATGNQIWFTEFQYNVYELAIGSDIDGDDVREVYLGGSSLGNNAGWVVCLNGRTGAVEWNVIADPNSSANVLTLTSIPDVTGDGLMEVIAGTRSDYAVLLNGATGGHEWEVVPSGSEVDALGILPDVDGNGSWEILTGSRDGTVLALSGGLLVSANPGSSPSVPATYQLGPAYPNPFNSVITIPYAVPQTGVISLRIYDILGRQVQTLFEGSHVPGSHRTIWEGKSASGSPVSSGTYIVVLESPATRVSSKVLLLK